MKNHNLTITKQHIKMFKKKKQNKKNLIGELQFVDRLAICAISRRAKLLGTQISMNKKNHIELHRHREFV